jgi:hypothetical protein
MRPEKGQSMHDLMCAVADEHDALFAALKRLQKVALNYVEAGVEDYEAIEQSNAALAKAGDPDAISADRELARLGLSTR